MLKNSPILIERAIFSFSKNTPVLAFSLSIQGEVCKNMHIRKAKGQWARAKSITRMSVILYRDNRIKFTQLYRLTDGEWFEPVFLIMEH